jgi:hypothetical protein
LDEYQKQQDWGNIDKTKMSNKIPLGEKKLEDSEILKGLLKELRYSGLQFGQKIGYASTASIHHVLNKTNGRTMSEEMINRIIKNFPDVNYWYLKKGQLPIILENNPVQNQTNIIFEKEKADSKNTATDNNLEIFGTLKNIEATLLRIEVLLNKKSDQ